MCTHLKRDAMRWGTKGRCGVSSAGMSGLDDIRVASPCSASWNEMRGDERRRFCGSCRLHVYDLSSLTRAEAEALILSKEGKLCVRFYRRADGRLLTKDCGKGRRIAARALQLTAAAAFLIGGALGFVRIHDAFATDAAQTPKDPASTVTKWVNASWNATPTPSHQVLMGKIAMPHHTPTPTPKPGTKGHSHAAATPKATP